MERNEADRKGQDWTGKDWRELKRKKRNRLDEIKQKGVDN